MKRFIGLVCLSMLAIVASAQITWNAKGGIGLASCYGSDTEGLKNHLVYKIGVGIEKPLSNDWSLMPSLELAWKGTKFKSDDNFVGGGGSSRDDCTLDIFYIQVPIVAAYRMNLTDEWNLAIKAGPYFAFAVSDKYSYSTSFGSDSYSAGIKKFDAGLDFGVDFERHRFVFGVEVEAGFTKLMDDYNIKNLAYYATVGWKF